MKLLIIDPTTTGVITSVEDGIPVVTRYPLFVVEPESRADIVAATHLFSELFETYSKEK
jgi:hypothetical protein